MSCKGGPIRLKRRADFIAARKGGRARRDAFSVQMRKREASEQLLPGERPDALRIGFTVTKKIGNAVVRNRIKRRLRAATDALASSASHAAHDIVVMADAPALHMPFDQLCRQLHEAIGQAHARLQNPAPRGKTRSDRSRKPAAREGTG